MTTNTAQPVGRIETARGILRIALPVGATVTVVTRDWTDQTRSRITRGAFTVLASYDGRVADWSAIAADAAGLVSYRDTTGEVLVHGSGRQRTAMTSARVVVLGAHSLHAAAASLVRDLSTALHRTPDALSLHLI